jgi:hypothetical protein
LTDIKTLSHGVKRKGGAGARAGNGDIRGMHPIRSRINKSWKHGVECVITSSKEAVPVLSKPAVEAASMQASATIPAALRVMLDFEKYFGMQHAPAGMEGGQCRVTLSMNLWVNLANSTHYDGNNVSQGFSIWMAPLMIGIQFFLK